MLLSISPREFRRLEPYLPRGLVAGHATIRWIVPRASSCAWCSRSSCIPGRRSRWTHRREIGACRTPVREALRLLETEGLVSSLANRGFVVRRLDPQETEHLYQARHASRASSRAKLPPSRQGNSSRTCARCTASTRRCWAGPSDRRRLGMLVDKAFHLRIAEQARNPYLTALLANIFDRLILTRPIEGFPVNRMGAAVQEHAAGAGRLRVGQRRARRGRDARNIDNGGASIVAHLRSLREFAGAPRRKTSETGGRMKTFLCRTRGVLAAWRAAGVACAQYPERPITFVVPFAAGGATDTLARQFAERMARGAKQRHRDRERRRRRRHGGRGQGGEIEARRLHVPRGTRGLHGRRPGLYKQLPTTRCRTSTRSRAFPTRRWCSSAGAGSRSPASSR